MKISKTDVEKMLSNPFYCLPKIAPIFIEEHEPLVTEEQWIKAGAKSIKEIGAEKFLSNLLENLKGNYPT
jgi:hypothetical protein